MDRSDPDVSVVSSLVPTFSNNPKEILDGKLVDSVKTETPFESFETSYFA